MSHRAWRRADRRALRDPAADRWARHTASYFGRAIVELGRERHQDHHSANESPAADRNPYDGDRWRNWQPPSPAPVAQQLHGVHGTRRAAAYGVQPCALGGGPPAAARRSP